MKLIEDLYSGGILPIVLHKVVIEKKSEWEDVHLSTFCKMLEYIGDRWIIPQMGDTRNNSGWVLTFDDGNLSDYELVFPLLLEKEIKATFFLIANKIGTNGYLNWSQVKEMHRNGMCIASHSLSHRKMTMLSKKEAIRELIDSKKILEDFISAPVLSFSYPYGECNAETHQLGIDAGYNFLFTSRHGVLKKLSNIFPRNSINSTMSWLDVVNVISPSVKTKLKCHLEDLAKDSIKNIIGQENYIQLRNKYIDK